MCRPTYFAVDYSINPWMDPDVPVDVDLAIRQWTELADTYRRLGHQVELIDPEPGLPDMVFAANSGTVVDGRVLGARFRAVQRAAEAEHYRRWFVRRGFRDIVMPAAINEAEGDFAWTGRLLLAGTGFRTDPAAHAEAQEVLGVPVVSLHLTDPRYYHLDTALCVLDDSPGSPSVAYYPGAFSAGSLRVLRKLFPDAVLASDADAACLGLNGVS
ncbi:MAG TPA: amidinotransferase, partial [Pseudonocardiaceae bacterium]|nr:amidinotransferase [Pseudonocardiaceae bacterium]